MSRLNTTFGPHVDLISGAAFKSRFFTDDSSDVPLVKGENLGQTLLVERPLSRSAIADGLGHQSVSAGLKRIIRDLLIGGRIAYTIPGKPNSRLQRYRITPAGQSALEEPAK